jgi:hypothetical protein
MKEISLREEVVFASFSIAHLCAAEDVYRDVAGT